MDQFKQHFKRVLLKQAPKRQDIILLKHEAQLHNLQICNELAHVLEDTICDLSPAKLQKLQKIYDKHF